MKKWLLTALVVLIVAISLATAAYAISMFTKNLAALGKVNFTDECTVEEIEVDDLTTIKVKLLSNANTVADRNYSVRLYLDGVETAGQLVSWLAGEIPGTRKTITFTGLSLSAVTTVRVDVTH